MKSGNVFPCVSGFLAVVLVLAACSFEIPEKVHVTGSPKYAVNLGIDSIEAFNLSDYFGIEDIKEAFNDNKDFDVYEYTYDPDPGENVETMTYLLHYKPDPIEIKLDTDDFNFNTGVPEKIVLANMTIPDISSAISSSISLPVPPGPPISSIPLTDDVPFSLFLGPPLVFQKAVIGTGSISFSAAGYDFSLVTIELKDGSTATPGPISPVLIDGKYTYNLANKEIVPGTKIHFNGTLKTSSPVSGPTITVGIIASIEEYKSLTIDTGGTVETQDFEVDLSEIKDWVKSIKFTKFGVKIGDVPVRVSGIEVTVTSISPILGGVPLQKTIDENNYEEFYDGGGEICLGSVEVLWELDLTDYSPSYKPKLKITSDFTGAITFHDISTDFDGVVELAPEPVFEWSEAVVDPAAIAAKTGTPTIYDFPELGEYIDLSDLFESLEDAIGEEARKIALDKAYLYIYIASSSDLVENTGFKVTATYTDRTDPEAPFLVTDDPLTDPTNANNGFVNVDPGNTVKAPEFEGTEYGSEIPEQYPRIAFERIINARPDDFRLQATVDLPAEAEVTPDADSYVRISPQIVIELPLSFRVTGTPDLDNYVSLDLDKLLPDDQADLFEREDEGDMEDLFEFMEKVNFSIKYTNNLGMDGAILCVTPRPTDSGSRTLSFPLENGVDRNITESLSREDIKWPFMPHLELKIPDQGGSGGFLQVKRQSSEADSFKITSMSVISNMVIDKTY